MQIKVHFFCKNAALTDLFSGVRGHEKYIYTMYIYRKVGKKWLIWGEKEA